MQGWSRHSGTTIPTRRGAAIAEHADSGLSLSLSWHGSLRRYAAVRGQGTTRLFELIGAPYIIGRLCRTAEFPRSVGGTRSCVFQPTFQKHANVSCGGVQIHVTSREAFEPVIVGLAMVKTAYDMYGESFRWKEPPYEYVHDRNPFDVIAGTDELRKAIERGDDLKSIEESWQAPLQDFKKIRNEYLLY